MTEFSEKDALRSVFQTTALLNGTIGLSYGQPISEHFQGPIFEDPKNVQFRRFNSMYSPILVLYEETGGLFKGNFNVCIVPNRQNLQSAKSNARMIEADANEYNRPIWPKNSQLFIFTGPGVGPFENPISKFEVVLPASQATSNSWVHTKPLPYIPHAIPTKIAEIEKMIRAYEAPSP